jgi:hypothetical protein
MRYDITPRASDKHTEWHSKGGMSDNSSRAGLALEAEVTLDRAVTFEIQLEAQFR